MLVAVGIAIGEECSDPDFEFKNSFSENLKGEECSQWGDGKYCYIECKEGFRQLAPIETGRTKITCECANDVCDWIAKKPFEDCFQCPTPIKTFDTAQGIENYLKRTKDYSSDGEDWKKIFPSWVDAEEYRFRIQSA